MLTPLPPGAGVVSAPASLDSAAVSALLSGAAALTASGVPAVVVDCSAIVTVDASAVAGFAWLASSIRSGGATAHAYDVAPAVAIALGDTLNAYDSATVV